MQFPPRIHDLIKMVKRPVFQTSDELRSITCPRLILSDYVLNSRSFPAPFPPLTTPSFQSDHSKDTETLALDDVIGDVKTISEFADARLLWGIFGTLNKSDWVWCVTQKNMD